MFSSFAFSFWHICITALVQAGCPDGYYRNGTGKVGRNCVRCPGNAMKCIGPALITATRHEKRQNNRSSLLPATTPAKVATRLSGPKHPKVSTEAVAVFA